jgi:hypothetical protein
MGQGAQGKGHGAWSREHGAQGKENRAWGKAGKIEVNLDYLMKFKRK